MTNISPEERIAGLEARLRESEERFQAFSKRFLDITGFLAFLGRSPLDSTSLSMNNTCNTLTRRRYVRITTKGQVTIPVDIRQRLRLLPGSEVEFEVEGNVVKIVRKAGGQGRGRRIVEHLRARGSVKMSTDEIMALTRE